MSWLFSQALGAAFSEGTSLAGQPFAQLNVMPTPHKFWRNDKTIEFSNLSRFGLTSQLLTEDHGTELLTSFLVASRAKISARAVQVSVSPEHAVGCGLKWQGSFVKWDQNLSSWKTAQESLLEDSALFLETWPKWGSMRDGACYLQPNLAPTIYGSASGLLPTPTRSWARRGPGISQNMENLRMSLSATQTCLAIVKAVGWLWPPSFVEWMMGWPILWTELQPLEMDKFHEWQQQHGGF